MRKFLALIQGCIVFILLYAIFLTYQNTTPHAFAQACTTPGTVTNVHVTYPDCNDTTCSFTQANCTWDAITGAASYTAKVTEVDSGAIIQNTSIASGTTKTVFAVTSGKTYKCDITAVNSCGQSGGTGSDSLLCKVDGITAAPTSPPAATSAPIVKNTPRPTLAPTGATENMIMAGAITAVFIIIGFTLFIL